MSNKASELDMPFVNMLMDQVKFHGNGKYSMNDKTMENMKFLNKSRVGWITGWLRM